MLARTSWWKASGLQEGPWLGELHGLRNGCKKGVPINYIN